MRNLVFKGKTWEQYEDIRAKEKVLHKNCVAIIKEMLRGVPAQGLGKPEPLQHGLTGLWSRRLSQRDRIIYRFDAQTIEIIAIGGHYDDK